MKLIPIELSTYTKKYGDDTTAPLWVVNRTKPRGNCAFTCIGELNRPVPVIVPATFIPIDLTTMLPRSKLLESSAFRRQLSRGDLAIVPNEQVEELFRVSKNAIEERQRLNKFYANDDMVEFDTSYDVEAESKSRQTITDNTFVEEVISRSIAGEDADSLSGLILNKSDSMSKDDMLTIINNVTDSRLKEKVSEIMNDLMD